jgi:hypothetical protein
MDLRLTPRPAIEAAIIIGILAIAQWLPDYLLNGA